MERLKRLTFAVISASLAAQAIAGCSGSPVSDKGAGDASVEPPLTATGPVTSAAQLSLPLDSYYLTPEQQIQFQGARNIYLHNCMKRYSFDFTVPAPTVARYPKNATQLGWRGELQSSRYGYHGQPGLAAEIAKASQAQQVPIVVPPEQLPVFEGSVKTFAGVTVPNGGCLGDFQRRVNAGAAVRQSPGDPNISPERQLGRLEEQAITSARADSRYTTLIKSWSACMKASGFTYPNVDVAESDSRWGSESSVGRTGISGLEIKTAVTDDTCRDKVNYSGMMRGLITAYQNRLIEKNGELLHDLRVMLLQRLKNSALINSTPE